MSEDRTLTPIKVISAGDMSGSLASSAIDIRFLDNIGIQLVWTGTPTGTFGVTGSVDGSTFTAISLSPSVTAAGSASNALIDLNQLSCAYIKVIYTASSGSGTLNAWVMGRAN